MVSETTRAREAGKYAGYLNSAAHGAPLTLRPGEQPPSTSSSSDSSLTAFAQLVVFRLEAARCLISLFSEQHQLVVAEATRDSAITPNIEGSNHVWLGCTKIPRSFGICERVLATQDSTPADSPPVHDASSPPTLSELPIFVVPDLAEDTRFSDRPFVRASPFHRFYAGVPIRSPRGIDIGVLCVFSDKPRTAPLTESQTTFLRDMSCTLMDHFNSKRSIERYRRTERMVRGIGSFVEGKSTMSQWWLGENPAFFKNGGLEGSLNSRQQQLQKQDEAAEAALLQRASWRQEPESHRRTSPMGKTGKSISASQTTERPMPDSTAAESALPEEVTEDSAPEERMPRDRSPDGSSAEGPASPDSSAGESAPTETPRAKSAAKSLPSRATKPPSSSREDKRSTEAFSNTSTIKAHSNESVGSTLIKSFSDDHSAEIKATFGKASNIIRESTEVEGVLILDATVGSYGGLVGGRHDHSPASSTESLNDISSSGGEIHDPAEEDETDKHCGVLGFSTSDSSSIDNANAGSPYCNIPESLLRTLLRRYPMGKIFNFDGQGGMLSSSDSDKGLGSPRGSTPSAGNATSPKRKDRTSASRRSEADKLLAIFHDARSLAFVPLWDVTREKWHAATFVWTRNPARIFTMQGEFSYLRAFATTIMGEINRMETAHAEKSKSDLLGSLSHELRSPLHGVIGAVELMQDTQLDAFQADVLHSMEACSRTMLDVIDHLLDYSKVNKLARTAKMKSKGRVGGEIRARQRAFESELTSLQTETSLDILTEETIEGVAAGFNYQRRSTGLLDGDGHDDSKSYETQMMQRMDSINASDALGQPNRGNMRRLSAPDAVTIIVDIEPSSPWLWGVQPGSLRRIIMNLLGNSLKFTSRGFIVIKLRQEQVPKPRNGGKSGGYHPCLKLTIVDTGQGIGESFLRNKLFVPFSQEDDLQTGTGVGLSVVHQITKSLNGSIFAQSQLGVGTCISVTLPLVPPREPVGNDDGKQARGILPLVGLRVSLSGLAATIDNPVLQGLESPTELELMEKLCQSWLGLEVVPFRSPDIHPDLIICKETSLSEVTGSFPTGCLPPVVVICHNAMTAHEYTTGHQKATRTDFFEFISQPAGPRKLGKALVLALKRWRGFRANKPWTTDLSGYSAEGSSYFPRPSPAGPPGAGYSPDTSAKSEPEHQEDSEGPTSSASHTQYMSAEPGLEHEEELERSTPGPKGPAVKEPERSSEEPADPPAAADATNQQPQLDANEDDGPATEYLLVDDNKINIQILVSFMKKMKLSYKTASNGLEALQIFAKQPSRFCCILMDISMPVMDGLEATRRIRELQKTRQESRLFIFALTGLASASTQKEAFASGIDLYLTKPIRLKQLTDVLKEKGLQS